MSKRATPKRMKSPDTGFGAFSSKGPDEKALVRWLWIRNQHRDRQLAKDRGTNNRFRDAHLKKLGLTE